MTMVWPIKALPPLTTLFSPMPRTRGGGVTISGIEQLASSGAGVWRAMMTCSIGTQDKRRAWRAIEALLEGRANTILVPIVADGPAGLTPTPLNLPFSDISTFSDTAEFEQGLVTATVAPAAINAKNVTVTVTSSQSIAAGDHFSIGERLYRITTSFAAGTPGVYSVSIWPWLRDAVLVATVVDFDTPSCRMRLAADNAMEITFGRLMVAQSASVSFIEDL